MLLGWGSDAFTQAKERDRMSKKFLTRDEVIEALTHSRCVVKFTKVNGEVREMPCTLRKDLVPKYERKTPVKEGAAKAPSNAISVWCLDKKEWRSFRLENLLELRLDLGMPVVD